MTEPARGPTLVSAVQTSPDLAVWTTHSELVMQHYSEGQGEIVGDASFRLDWGRIAEDGSAPTTVADVPDLGGLYVRILKEDALGAITIGADTFTAVWHGRMLSPGTTTTVGSGTTMYTAAGIAVVLNDRKCWVGRSIVKTSPVTFSTDFNLKPFNHWPSGDRSTAAGTVGGVNVYLHDATNASTGNQWTARNILDYLFACSFKYEHPPTPSGSGQLGLNWAISDPQLCLSYEPQRFDARGLTLTEVLNELAGKRRGLSWFVTVSGSTLTINIASGVPTAITVGTFSVPANPNVWDQLDTTDPFLYPVTVREISDEVADEIVIQGAPRRIGITLSIYGTGSPWASDSASSLVKGWTNSQETACNTYLDSGNDYGRRLASYDRAWCRFALRTENWNGAQYGGGGMPDSFATVSNASYGVNGYDGTVSRTGLSTLAGLWYGIDGSLPCGSSFGQRNTDSRRSLVIVAEDDAVGTWVDHTTGWQVRVETSPPAVLIDDGAEGVILRGILRAGRKVLVSLTLEDFLPFQVMWRRDPANWIAVPPRTKTIERPELGQEYILAGMVTGASAEAGGTLTTAGAQVTSRDDVTKLRALLAQARAFYVDPYRIASFTDRGVWDSDPAYRPGTILGVVTDGVDPRTIDAMVTRRTVRLEYADGDAGVKVPYWSTTWETDQFYPDLEAAL